MEDQEPIESHTVKYPSGRNKEIEAVPKILGISCGCLIIIITVIVVMAVVLARSTS
jgi:hypothetical protein